ncbi:methyltransferase domain-containing protein [Colletotrichum truncatum]|uniref:Methyltransferase domain-containing protein n=1 Tax=Colletotrichum truncatum TaxID=5467 RepID=A0ACC3YNW8_COLTU|nr:methyltransferase domain-containing protein [Colletotrichum truncatum]KAF6791461.1 methyltransferase domain-containing protein [Colletotrichum truncatum]
MSQYMYTTLAPLPPVFSHIDSTRSATAKATPKSSSSTSSAPTKDGNITPSASAATPSAPATTPTSASFSKANPTDSSRLPPLHRQKNYQYQPHSSTRLEHIRTSSSSSASRSSHETSTTPTSTTLSIPHTASPTDPRPPASPTTPQIHKHKHKHHQSLQDTRTGGDHGHSFRSRAPARLRKESGSLSSYAKLALQSPPTPRIGLTPTELKHVAMLDMDISGRHLTAGKATGTVPFSRTDSLSSAAPSTASISARTMTSSDPTSSSFDASRPYVLRNGRTYLSDNSLAYPLPVDLVELHRQSMRTLMMIQVFGSPLCSQQSNSKAPGRVLEVACGSGFWSQMCHRYFKGKGHSDIQYTGIDIGPMGATAGDADRDMKWRYVQHDMRVTPWPFADGEFDLVMVKDLSLAVTTPHSFQSSIEEYYRILRPGGILEFWDSDHQIRMLRPHAAPLSKDSEEGAAAVALGAYPITSKTPLSAPLNNFLVEYNSWVHKALESRNLSPVPCTLIGPALVQECEELKDVQSRRLAIPLSEARWEREGVGGVVTKDGKSYIETGKGKAKPDAQKTTLTSAQAALRRTAMMTVVQQIQSLEPILRETSGKSQDEWDGWLGKMMNDLTRENGTSWGECLEVGAWWATRR